ncbi:hypothetical protein [Mycolicibacterium smegmatis]|uniref:Uncharacterized protein n=1 Tax=Mycolicibacterium smegmatis (strain MKD8) TaxID=1214915 RepID=A0A2U9PND0_MYCSE|nr:hypothetical protein [Mycolicibacterium smegmatis]AWT53272.1 hypothetical protein D806_022910 [Mycolicibacterium smegmatis MKD8]
MATSDNASKRIYRGDIPGDSYEGRWPERLTIYAQSGPDGFELDFRDSVEWPERDMHWTFTIAPDQLSRLREVFGAPAGTPDSDLPDLIGERIADGTLPVKSVGAWLRDQGIEFSATSESFEN